MKNNVSYDDIVTAYQRIQHQVTQTPLLYSRVLSALNKGTVYLKCENLQHTGSFKFRGGSNAILSLPPQARTKGVLAYSSGNHAQGVACAAQLAGIGATIVMPQDAPAVKIHNTKAFGANVVLYDRYSESREAIGEDIAAQTGAELIRPYDDVRVIAGQGTCGYEIAFQLTQRSIVPDSTIVCCGGGGLATGTAIAMKQHFADVQMFIAEPSDMDDFTRSLRAGERLSNDPTARSICDAIITPTPGEITFPLAQSLYQGGVVADDDTVKEAVRLLYTHHRMIAEPGGAIAVASFMAARDKFHDQTVVLTISGGNVDTQMLVNILGLIDD